MKIAVWQNLNWVWAVVCIAVLAYTPSAHATGTQTMRYSVYAGGVHVIDADLVIDTSDPQAFSIRGEAVTHGVLGKIVPWSGVFSSNGWTDNAYFKPTQHQSISTWRGETETKTYKYNKDGTFGGLTVKDHDKPLKKKNVEAALTDGTTDIMTATLNAMMLVAEGKSCAKSSDIFDGKRRFRLDFQSLGENTMTPTKYNAYQGKAEKCTIEVTPVSGKWSEKPRGWLSIQEQGRGKGTIPTVWMAQLADNQPAVPVKIMAKTDYGTFMMHLQHFKSDDTTLSSKKWIKAQD